MRRFQPPVPAVTTAVLYGVGLMAGSVFSFPPVWPLATATLAAIAVAATGRASGLLVVLAGALLGSAEAQLDRSRCEHRWSQGKNAAWLVLHDTPLPQTVSRGTILHAAEGCRGSIGLVFESESIPVGGSLVLVAGNFRNGVLRVTRVRVVRPRYSLRYGLRAALENRIRGLYGGRGGTVAAMVLGRRDDVPEQLRHDFAAAGLAHLLAISGLHVGIVAGWLLLLARVFRLGRRSAWLATTGVWCYVALLAFPAPAMRAAAFVTIRTVSRRVERSPPIEAVLAVAAMVVFSVDPGAILSKGAWLSVAAVWGTGLAAREMKRFGISSPPLRLVGTSIGATLATAPITAVAFGSVAPIGVASNLIGVPLVGLIVPGILASLVAGPVLAAGTGLLLWALETVARSAAAIPGGHLSGTGWSFGLTAVAVSGIVLWGVRRRPTWLRLRLRLVMGAAGLSWAGAVLALAPPGGPREGLSIYVIDVGQGDAIAVRTPANHWMLVDGGPRFGSYDAGARTVVPFLNSLGVDRLEILFVSHGDADHLGGVPAILESVETRLVVEPGQPLASDLYLDFLTTVDESGADWIAGRTGDVFRVDSVEISVLHPGPDWLERQIEVNENSLVLLLTYRDFTMLFTGDAGEPAEAVFSQRVGPVDVLKVGHHGSAGSTTDGLIEAARPRAAVISVGADNSFGHPAPRVTSLLADLGAPVFRTDIAGTVTIWSNGGYFDIRQKLNIPITQRLMCLLRALSRLNASSSSRNACTLRRQPAISRRFSTTSPWPARSSPATSGAPGL